MKNLYFILWPNINADFRYQVIDEHDLIAKKPEEQITDRTVFRFVNNDTAEKNHIYESDDNAYIIMRSLDTKAAIKSGMNKTDEILQILKNHQDFPVSSPEIKFWEMQKSMMEAAYYNDECIYAIA